MDASPLEYPEAESQVGYLELLVAVTVVSLPNTVAIAIECSRFGP